ncbi:MAG: tRNA (guanosine(37)-N1)-methyltransferase TrmD [Clostridia bacterium]|nr:tRNA (guanosine(37)-N1)-methyltransferase TrmD [Clostridia bacterium]
MIFDVLTLFPMMVDSILNESIIGRAREAGLIELRTHDIRDFSNDKHRRVDDTPYGGGMGMLMRVDPIVECHEKAMADLKGKKVRTIVMSPQGQLLTQKKAKELSEYDALVIICGHYEGIDRRAVEICADEEISIGDYILTGGELPACILIDSVSRLIDGVLADASCHEEESVACGMLEYPQYTRPVEYRGLRVPEVLTCGDHAKIKKWRFDAALRLTEKNRPDMLGK